jgi:cystathionine beta-lyase
MEISEIVNHYGEERSNYLNAVTTPVFQSSIFCFDNVAALREGLKKEWCTPFYTRGYNPTVAVLRKKMAALEGAEDALVFGSGSAAIAAAVISCVKAGDHVVCVQKPYSWTNKLLTALLARFNVHTTMVDGTETDQILGAVQPNTTLIYLESPNSMTFEVQDIGAVAAFAREKGITTIIDNSYCTPLNQQPIAMGIDMVCHSASKYISGHSDVVAGVLCGSSDRIRRIFEGEYMTLGGIISPNDAWLLIRGLRTLPVRIKHANETGVELVQWLEKHPKVSRVYYPFAEQNPQRELAKRQMKGAGSLFALELKARDIAEMEAFCNSLQHFLITCSWGGYESLIYPACALYDSQNYGYTTLPWNYVRLYVGLEPVELIKADLENAFRTIKG